MENLQKDLLFDLVQGNKLDQLKDRFWFFGIDPEEIETIFTWAKIGRI